jgi:hypothetical protein
MLSISLNQSRWNNLLLQNLNYSELNGIAKFSGLLAILSVLARSFYVLAACVAAGA